MRPHPARPDTDARPLRSGFRSHSLLHSISRPSRLKRLASAHFIPQRAKRALHIANPSAKTNSIAKDYLFKYHEWALRICTKKINLKFKLIKQDFSMDALSDIKSFAKKAYLPIIQDGGLKFMCGYIKKHNIKNILEIGTAIAYSAINFAKAAEDVHVTTIEYDLDRHIQAKQNVTDCGLSEKITLVYGDALEWETDEKFDLIFIDAAKAQYIRFFEKFKSNLTEKGVIITDNLKFHGMVNDLSLTHNYSTKKLVKKIIKYIDFLKTNTEFHTDFYDDGDGISVSYKNR